MEKGCLSALDACPAAAPFPVWLSSPESPPTPSSTEPAKGPPLGTGLCRQGSVSKERMLGRALPLP
eukprot:2181340-Alexandrium_andersonii.AAC.1